MRLPSFRYLRASSVQEVTNWLETYGGKAKVLAGGTDLLVALKQRRELPEYIISLAGLRELAYVREECDRLHIGAMTTLYALSRAALVNQRLPALAQAARAVGAVRLQTAATVGGNLCLDTRCKYYNQSDLWRRARPTCCKMGGERCLVTGRENHCSATFAADLAPVLLVMGARARMVTPAGEKVLPLSDFYPADGDGREPNLLAKRVRGILTEVEVPLVPGKRAVYRKFRLRGGMDFSLVGVAAAVTGSPARWEEGAIAVTGVASRPLLLGAGTRLVGRPTGDLIAAVAAEAAREVHPAPTGNVPVSYQRQMLQHLIREALQELAE